MPENLELPPYNIKSVVTYGARDIIYSNARLSGSVSLFNEGHAVRCGIVCGTSSDNLIPSYSSYPPVEFEDIHSFGGHFEIDISGLKANTTYYYRAYASEGLANRSFYRYGDIRSFTTNAIEESVTTGEVVDLGLSVKWASCNVGATSPEDYGDYFSWGETSPKSRDDYSFTDGLSISELESRGIIDSDGNLTATYDAATVNLGDAWRMPTFTEMEELFNKCTWRWIPLNGIYGCKFTGPNGNSIFLPAAGYYSGYGWGQRGLEIQYLSATADSSESCAYGLCFYPRLVDWFSSVFFRDKGYTVRPVSD